MAEKICLDTDVCIAIINGEQRAENFRQAAVNVDLYLSSITIFELYLRKTKLEKITEFLSNFRLAVLPLDENSAIKSSQIFKSLEKSGSLVEFRDVFTASIAVSNNCKFATFNKKHFSKISELKLLEM